MLIAYAAIFHAYFVLGTGGSFYSSFLRSFRLGILADFVVEEIDGSNQLAVKRSLDAQPISSSVGANDTSVEDVLSRLRVGKLHNVFFILFFRLFIPCWQDTTHLWFFVASLCLTILMMNILIGILGSNYDR